MLEQPPESFPSTGSEEARASGKVILFGEHAVVYGVRAIAAGISRGVVARSHRAERDSITVDGVKLDTEHALASALKQMRSCLGSSPAQLLLQSELPQSAGLGSSAAMAVAGARAIIKSHGLERSEREIFNAAQAWEGVFHGTPSGVDVAAAQANALISYVKGSHPEPLNLGKKLHLIVAQAGPPSSTKMMVDLVAKSKQRNPQQFEKTLTAISSVVENAALLLRQGELSSLGQLMNLNHMLLAGWMLSTEEIETACQKAREIGALGAKLTGAGGGGCIVALADGPTNQKDIVRALESLKIPAFETTVGEDL